MKGRSVISKARNLSLRPDWWAKTSSVLATLVVCTCLSFGQTQTAAIGKGVSDAPAYTPVHHFIPTRDAAADIRAALLEARKTDKRVLVDVGGDWCPYCQQMDLFFYKNPALLRMLDERFVMVKVFFGKENRNEKVLSAYPKVEGIPHMFVLGPDGTVLHSQHVLELRTQGAYDVEKMKQFLLKWAPQVAADASAAASSTSEKDSSKPESEGPH